MRRRGCMQALALAAALPWAGSRAAVAAAPGLAAHDTVMAAAQALDVFVVLRRASAAGQRVDWFDGKGLELRGRFTSPAPLHPRLAFSASATGHAHAWLSTAAGDAVRLRLDAEEPPLVRPLGRTLAGLAVAADGGCVMAVHDDPPQLVFWDAALAQPLGRIAVATREGRAAAGVAAWCEAAMRRSFFVAPAGLAELWEISHDRRAEDFYEGLVHDYRFGEGVPTRGYLGARRIRLPRPLASLALDPEAVHVLGEGAGSGGASDAIDIVNPDVRRRVAVLDGAPLRLRGAAFVAAAAAAGASSAAPHAASLLVPLAGQPALALVDSEHWTIAARIALPGEAIAVAAHRRAPQALVSMRTSAGDLLGTLDLQHRSLASMRRFDGVRLAPPVLSRDGKRVLVVREGQALLVLDASTLADAAELPGDESVAVRATAARRSPSLARPA
ncbi:MAG: hypothetical protein U1F25_05990 [Rubrivivax sp.]